ncbi:hypothetical protein HID58_033420, partial [Brassica napus]
VTFNPFTANKSIASLGFASLFLCRNQAEFTKKIAEHVREYLDKDLQLREQCPNPQGRGGEDCKPEEGSDRPLNIIKPGKKRLEQLEEKLAMDCDDNENRIVGVVGMAGVGKTYLAKTLFKKLKKKISSHAFIEFDNEVWKDQKLQKTLVESLLNNPISCDHRNPLEIWKDTLIKKKVVIVFDNVRDKKQIEPLVGNCNWIKKGSRIVITTRDKSLLKELTCDLYEVPKLSDIDSLELFRAQLSKKLRICYDELNEHQKNVFLDIAYFFRSRDEKYITSLVDSFDPEDAEGGKKLRGLTDKFLIDVCDGRVEMHDLLFMMATELLEINGGKYWLFPSNCAEITSALRKEEGRDKVRGVVIDMSEMKEMALDNELFVGMSSLRYLKVYNSRYPIECKAYCKLNVPDGFEFPLDNIVRYLDWVKFPGKVLPSDFDPKNLIDLRLRYSSITSVWNCAKDTPKLRWVDLSHSSRLSSLLGLSKAPTLLRLNLEGCTSLKKLPEEMKEMKSLVLLNLKECTSLLSLPTITIDSLKTLILSGCSNLGTFKVISKNLENVYLNGTGITELPPAIGNLQKLILLNLNDCEKLATLPNCLWNIKSLQELKLSRSSMIKSFPDVKEKMTNLQLLLLDETSITEMPCSFINLSFLRHLSLSRNNNICSLQFDISKLFHLKWLDVKCCTNLTCLPTLPPNLKCLNAYGCTSLRTLASPVAVLMPTKKIHYSTFIFTNCHKLEQASKSSIISYVQRKSELMSDDRYNQDFVFKSLIGTCLPECGMPAWFNHQEFGPVLNLEFPRDWNKGKLNGIALCVVVSFKDYKDQTNGLQVKCTCEFTNVSLSRESFIIGGWSEPGDEPHTIESDHVFIGYTTLFNIKKRHQFPSSTGVSFRFEVTNGTIEVAACKVMKCGFTLVYEPEDDYLSEATVKTGNGKFAKLLSMKI